MGGDRAPLVRPKLRGYERAEPDATATPGKRKAAPGSSTPGGPEPIGALLTRRRLALGFSQLRLAEKLCDVSGMPTVSRHEVSRWEREDRLPGRFWLGWLAVVFGVPLERLEAAMAASRGHSGKHPAAPPSYRSLWTPPTASELLAVLDMAPTHDLGELAHAWVTGPPDAVPDRTSPALLPTPDHGDTDKSIERLSTRLRLLRRYDDLIGGCDLAPHVDRELRTAVELLRQARGAHHQRTVLALIAGYAQLAGWVHSDAGNNPASRRAYRAALRAAAASGDRLMGAHVLGSLSQHCLSAGDPHEALLLASTAHTGAQRHGTPLLRTLLLHRVALAAAWVGEEREAWQVLQQAEHTAERAKPAREPPWLYWLDQCELEAMTGRCLVVLGRPVRAIPILGAHLTSARPRSAAIYGIWLARAYLDIGETERAGAAARQAQRFALASGSRRALVAVRRHPHRRIVLCG